MKYYVNTLLFLCFALLVSPFSFANFDHSAVQKGAITESCYRDPCSGARVVDFKQLDVTENSSMIELTLLGYSKDWETEQKEWNQYSHKTYILCSLQAPTLILGSEVTTLPLNPRMGVSGALMSSTELYFQACHNYEGDDTVGAGMFGYDIDDDNE